MTVHLPPIILVIDPDPVSRTSASNVLERNGFAAVTKSNGEEALRFMDTASEYQKPHMVIVNSKLEGLSGIEICTILKTKSGENKIPVVFIAEPGEDVVSLCGLDNSFDDYLVRPFGQNELAAKVKVVLGRSKPVLRNKVLAFGNVKMDLMSYRVIKNNREVHLGPTEFKILQCFIEAPHRIFSRMEIMTYVWGSQDNVELRTVDVHINRLRSALSEPGQSEPTIKTVRAAGYCLELPQPVQ